MKKIFENLTRGEKIVAATSLLLLFMFVFSIIYVVLTMRMAVPYISEIDLYVPTQMTNTTDFNLSYIIPKLEEQGYNASLNDLAPGIRVHKVVYDKDDVGKYREVYIFISTNLSKLYISYRTYTALEKSIIDEKKKEIVNEVEYVADICNLTVIWNEAEWSYEYKYRDPFFIALNLPMTHWRSEGWGEARWNPSGDVWKVEEFPHWVWIYEVDDNGDNIPDTTDSLGQPYSVVKFTYTHPENSNLFDVGNPEWWPASYYLNNKRLNVYLPWFTNYTQRNGKYISTTELIWYWHAFDYDPAGEPYPTAVTRYYDASP